MSGMPSLDTPPEAGAVVERHEGDSSFVVYLVASQAGHPPAAEKAVHASLTSLHSRTPLERVFVSLDAAAKSGFEEGEMELGPYRAFANRSVSGAISTTMIDADLMSGGMAFGITAEPAARVHVVDDWYGWALQREALSRLNEEAGRIVLIAQLVDFLLPDGAPGSDRVRGAVSCVGLEWDALEWRRNEQVVRGLDPSRALAPLRGEIPEFEAIADFVAVGLGWAMEFYEAGAARADTIVDRVLASLREDGSRREGEPGRAAIVLTLPWLEHAAERLRAEGASFVALAAPGVSRASMLDTAGIAVGELSDTNRRLGELFSGKKRFTGRVEALDANARERARRRSSDWVTAGQALRQRVEVHERHVWLSRGIRALEAEMKKIEECFQRALAADPTYPAAWVAFGGFRVDNGRAAESLEYFDEALRLDAKDLRAWEGRGEALNSVGRSREARRALLRCVYLEPGTGRYWNRLGLHYHGRGGYGAACYCFDRGRALGDDMARQNWEMVCSGGRAAARPRSLHPVVQLLMRRIVLPSGHLWSRRSVWSSHVRALAIYGALGMTALFQLLAPGAPTRVGGTIPPFRSFGEILFLSVAAGLYGVGLATTALGRGWASIRWRQYPFLLPTGLLALAIANLWLRSSVAAWAILVAVLPLSLVLLGSLFVQLRRGPDS